jgi:hypothetical protein
VLLLARGGYRARIYGGESGDGELVLNHVKATSSVAFSPTSPIGSASRRNWPRERRRLRGLSRLWMPTGVVISRRDGVSPYCGGSGPQVRDKCLSAFCSLRF